MRIDWTISALGHAALLAWGLISLGTKPFQVPPEGVPVEIVTNSQFSQVMAGSKRAPPAPKPRPLVEKVGERNFVDDPAAKVTKKLEIKEAKAEPPAPEPRPKPPEPKPVQTKAQPAPAPRPKPPEPKPQQAKKTPKVDQIAEALKKADAKKRAEERKERQERDEQRKIEQAMKKLEHEPRFDSSKIAALLDKRDPQRHLATGAALNQTASLGLPTATAVRLSQNEIDALRRRISQCWNVPIGARDAQNMHVLIHLRLNKNGTVIGSPEVLGGTASPFGPAFAESGRRAILQCQPYTMLRPETYNDWKDIEIDFNASEMFSG